MGSGRFKRFFPPQPGVGPVLPNPSSLSCRLASGPALGLNFGDLQSYTNNSD